jgi:choline dehydrogenase-like flavoprotein
MAAGALHTPQILQLSGIGSSSVLGRLGINQIINLPGVGENFQDHPAQYLAVVVTNISDPTQNPAYFDQNKTYDAEMGVLYEEPGRGRGRSRRTAPLRSLQQITSMSRMGALLKRHSSLPPNTSDPASTARSSTALRRSRWPHLGPWLRAQWL